MSESLIPERPLVVSPSLAASIGLEQAVLIQHLEACCEAANAFKIAKVERGYRWTTTSLATLSAQLAILATFGRAAHFAATESI